MSKEPYSLDGSFWQSYSVNEEDVEMITSMFLEEEKPKTLEEITRFLIERRIEKEVDKFKARKYGNHTIYFPKEQFHENQSVVFPHLNWQVGKVIKVRDGYNPSLPPFKVIKVQFDNGEEKEFVSGLEEHPLNTPPTFTIDEYWLNSQNVFNEFGKLMEEKVRDALANRGDFINIGEQWFPRTLLIDFNEGQLNIAEATLDMANGEPLPTATILQHLDVESGVHPVLAEFSLNYALYQDSRFDEVGPSGEILWFLHRLAPKGVKEKPVPLRYQPESYAREVLTKEMIALEQSLDDEYIEYEVQPVKENKAVIKLIYPHWRSGTLPLTERVKNIFPTAYQAPRIRFWFVDENTKQKFPAWVVRQEGYIYGLEEWYAENGLMPGSIVHLQKGKAGEVVIKTGTQRSSRDYIRTILVGSDGGIVFAMLRQVIKAEYDERMAIFIPDQESLDQLWQKNQKEKLHLDTVVHNMVRNLAKLTPQGHVHAAEIYAAVNLIYRCPPGRIFAHLLTNPQYTYVGDLYFHLKESE